MDKAAILNRYVARLPESQTRKQYEKHARQFLDYADEFGKETVNGYIAKLRRQGYKPGSLRYIFGIIRSLYIASYGAEAWHDLGFARGDAPQVSERDEYRPALGSDIIEKIARAAVRKRLARDEAAFACLSLTYGLRRVELCAIGKKDIDLKNRTLFVQTAKSGRQRYHLIPEEILPYLRKHDWTTTYSPHEMSEIFWSIIRKAGLQRALREYRLGWHALRRPVVDALVSAGIPEADVNRFMRWKTGTADMAMLDRYYSSQVIHLSGQKAVVREAVKDTEIFAVHPFLTMLRSEGKRDTTE